MKRCFDFVTTGFALLILSPLMLALTLLVAAKMGRPVIYQQARPGLNGEIFRLRKFRTMTNARDANGALLPDDVRLTRFGRWLRSTSLDELPSLINVIAGDMSLVGPRPLLVQYLPHYSAEQARRHLVRPGLTGWAQVNGRNTLDWDDRFNLDCWYVDHQSFRLDLKILCMTIRRVLARSGINAEGEATMSAFTGSKPS